MASLTDADCSAFFGYGCGYGGLALGQSGNSSEKQWDWKLAVLHSNHLDPAGFQLCILMKRFSFASWSGWNPGASLFRMKLLRNQTTLRRFCHLVLGRYFGTTKGQMSQQCGLKAEWGHLYENTIKYGVSSLGSVEIVFCWDFNGKQKVKAQSCFYSEERFPPICCGWQKPLKRKLHPASPSVKEREKRKKLSG